MVAAYLATADVDAAIGATERQVLFSDNETVAGYNGTYFTALNNRASELAKSMAENAGYSPGDSTTDERLKAAALGLLLLEAYSRKLGAEAGKRRVAEHLLMAVDMLRDGRLRLGTPTARDAVGGAVFSGSSTTTTGDFPAIFRRDRQKGLY